MRARCFVRDVHDVDSGGRAKSFAHEMVRGAVAERREVERARFRFASATRSFTSRGHRRGTTHA